MGTPLFPCNAFQWAQFCNVFLGDFRSPRKTVFLFKIVRSLSAGYHGVLRAKSTNFKGLVFIPNTEKLLLWDLKYRRKIQINV